MNDRYHLGDQLEIRIEKIVTNGLGMGFGEEITVFVPFSATGDLLVVEIGELRGRTAFGSIRKILEEGKGRTNAPCVHFGECGGCDFQHLVYESQLDAKAGIIEDCLKRIGHIDVGAIEVVPSDTEFGYRPRTQFHHDPANSTTGFFRRLSHEVIDLDVCPILTEEMNNALGVVKGKLKDVEDAGELIHVDTAAVGETVSVYSDHLFEPVEEVSVDVGAETYFFSARSFFQSNLKTVGRLVELAVGDLEGTIALDLYAGAGLFSLPLSRSFEHVIAVEVDKNAIDSARRSAELARRPNIIFEKQNIREFLNDCELRPDLILVDPPRGGIKRNLLEKIISLAARDFVYVSCNPSTLARDLAVLLENNYEIVSLTGIDMFPQTSHVETVVRLKQVS